MHSLECFCMAASGICHYDACALAGVPEYRQMRGSFRQLCPQRSHA